MDAEADLIPRTPDAARVALATYLNLNQPPEGDPRAAAHKAAIVAADLLAKEAAPPRRRSPHHDGDYNARSDIMQRAVDRRREEREDRGDLEYDDRNEPIGAPCFSRAIRRTAVPAGFKLPSDIAKYTGAEDPKQWLEDFDTRIRVVAGGTRTTAMQCMGLYLADSARAWLRGLPAESIRTWS